MWLYLAKVFMVSVAVVVGTIGAVIAVSGWLAAGDQSDDGQHFV